MSWLVDTREDYKVFPAESESAERKDGVLLFKKAVDSDTYMCDGRVLHPEPTTVHVVTMTGAVSCYTAMPKAFVEVACVAEQVRVFAAYASVLIDGEMVPYSLKHRRFVTVQQFMDDLDSHHYPLKEIVDYIRRMQNVSRVGYGAT